MHLVDQYLRDIYTLITNPLIKERGYMFWYYNYLCGKNILWKIFGIKYTHQKFKHRTIYFDSFGAFFAIFTELFIYNIYHFTAENDKPFILDCGGNIGMAVFYFKYLYPQAHVESYEPDRVTFELLQKNMSVNGLNDVICRNEAVAWSTGQLTFYSYGDMEGGPGNTLEKSQVNFQNIQSYDVPAIKLSDKGYLHIDFLKIDIEWSEWGVMQDLATSNLITKIQRMSLEYHYDESITSNKLSSILTLLEQQKFHYILNINTLVTFYTTEDKFEELGQKYVLMLNCYR